MAKVDTLSLLRLEQDRQMSAAMRIERAFPIAIILLGLVVIAPALWSGWMGLC